MLNNINSRDSKKVVLVTIAGPEFSPTWENAAIDVSNVFNHPEHQAREDNVETMMLMMSCSSESRAAYSDAVTEARLRGLLKRPQPVIRREGDLHARAC